jgi:hypothetical protein
MLLKLAIASASFALTCAAMQSSTANPPREQRVPDWEHPLEAFRSKPNTKPNTF